MRDSWVVLLQGRQCGIFDTEADARLYVNNTYGLDEAKVVKMQDPWKAPGLYEQPVTQPVRAAGVTLYLLDADGYLIAQTDTGHILIVSAEGDELKAGMLIPIREDGRVSFKSLRDEQLVPRLAEAFVLLAPLKEDNDDQE